MQVNIGDEDQKSGINKRDLNKLVSYCQQLDLDLMGLMCIPPVDVDPEIFFNEMKQLNYSMGFKELSMGMSSDYIQAVKNSSTYIRIDLIFLVKDFKNFNSCIFLIILSIIKKSFFFKAIHPAVGL